MGGGVATCTTTEIIATWALKKESAALCRVRDSTCIFAFFVLFL
jgi:hypothetical protein